MSRSLLSFRLRGRLFGLDIDLVREIVPYSSISPVPSSSERLAGIMILRDRNVSVMDPGAALFGGRSESSKSSCVILIETQPEPFGLLIDAVEDVLALDPAKIEPPPPSVEMLSGTSIHGGETLLILERSLFAKSATALSDSWLPEAGWEQT